MRVTIDEYLALSPEQRLQVTHIDAADPEAGGHRSLRLDPWGPPSTHNSTSAQLERDWDRDVEEWPQQRTEIGEAS